jgi:hypothetical protein
MLQTFFLQEESKDALIYVVLAFIFMTSNSIAGKETVTDDQLWRFLVCILSTLFEIFAKRLALAE